MNYTSGNHSTALGHYASTSNANSIQLGNASTLSSLTCKVSLTVTSDERDKIDLQPIQNATEFLRRVNAISYLFNGRDLYVPKDEDGNEALTEEEQEIAAKYGFKPYNKEEHAKGTKKGRRRRVGVSAQTVLQALMDTYGITDECNIVNDNLHDFNKDDIPDYVESHLGVTYENFIPFLIRAIQELDERITVLESKSNTPQQADGACLSLFLASSPQGAGYLTLAAFVKYPCKHGYFPHCSRE